MITNWYTAESSEVERPAELDETSSEEYVYVRKNFEQIEVKSENSEESDDDNVSYKWVYLEQRVTKEDWYTYSSIIENKTNIELNDAGLMDVADTLSIQDEAITELGNIVSSLVEEKDGE